MGNSSVYARFFIALFFTIVVGGVFAALLLFGQDMSGDMVTLMQFVLGSFVGAATIAMARLANPDAGMQQKYDELRTEMLTDRAAAHARDVEQRRIIADLLDRLGAHDAPRLLEDKTGD